MSSAQSPAGPQERTEPQASLLLDTPEFGDIDRHFARFLERLSGGPNPPLALAAALVSRSRAQGHSCLVLRAVAGRMFPDDDANRGPCWRLPEADPWLAALRTSPV